MTINEEARRGRIVDLPADECMVLLSTTTIGRVAFVNEDGQQLVPVNFAEIDGVIYFRTVPDGFLAQLAHGHEDVAFGVDYHDDTYRHGWNVTVKGAAALVEDRATINMGAEPRATAAVGRWSTPARHQHLDRLDRRPTRGRSLNTSHTSTASPPEGSSGPNDFYGHVTCQPVRRVMWSAPV